MNFFEELKRRNVFKVGIAYVISAWILMQFVDLVLENVNAPDWVMQVFMLALAIGFPLAMFFAWAFEMTPEGIKKEKDVDRTQSITSKTGRKLDRSIIVVMALALVWFAWDKFAVAPGSGSIQPEAVQITEGSETGELNLTPAKEKSIAVLPFADLSQAKDQEWFADGLAEEILNALAKTPDLLVSSRTSSFRYKGSTLNLPDIAAELGVAHILEGSVRSSSSRIRVTAQLIRASDGFHVWSENYDRDIADMIEIQEDLALNIAKALKTTMDPIALAAMMNVGTRSVAAYEAYLHGQAKLIQSHFGADERDLSQQAYLEFERARSIDPGFATAHLLAADFWKVQLTPNRTDSGLTKLEPRQMLLEFNLRIDQAIASATTAADKKGYRAYKASIELRLHAAIDLYQAYLQDRPNDEDARYELSRLATLVSDTGLRKDIMAYWREHGATNQVIALAYVNEAHKVLDPSEAADFGLKALQRWPSSTSLLYQTHRALLWAGRILEANELAGRYSRVSPQDDTLVRARQACAEGRRSDAEAIYAAIDPDDIYGRSKRWHILMLLGKEREARVVLQPYADSGVPYQMTSWLSYNQFDPTPFPQVMDVLQREGIKRPPPVDIPFKCPPPEQTSIAVLPFVNMSTDADNEFFSDGIAEEILNVLASIPNLKVAARTSAFTYKGTNTNISQIAEELGVNHILEGSVRKSGNQVRVTAQLIKADDGFHLWSANYDRELTNIFAIQDEIAASIAEALKVTLALESGSTGNLTGTNSLDAYEHYLKGMSLWHQRTAVSLPASIDEFDAAIAIDPEFAKAYAGLALTWAVIDGYMEMDSEVTAANAKAAAERALNLEPENIEALSALGSVARYELRHEEAARLFEKVMLINPSYATAYQWYGGMLSTVGDTNRSIKMYQKAWSLDPRSRIIGNNLAIRLSGVGRNQEAEQIAQGVLGFAPEFPDILDTLFNINIMSGECEAARPYLEKLVKVLNKTNNSTQVYMDLCQQDEPVLRALAIQTILTWHLEGFADPAEPTLIYMWNLLGIFTEIGEIDAAVHLLEKQSANREDLMASRIRITPNGIRLQCDSRVIKLLEQSDVAPPTHPVNCNVP